MDSEFCYYDLTCSFVLLHEWNEHRLIRSFGEIHHKLCARCNSNTETNKINQSAEAAYYLLLDKIQKKASRRTKIERRDMPERTHRHPELCNCPVDLVDISTPFNQQQSRLGVREEHPIHSETCAVTNHNWCFLDLFPNIYQVHNHLRRCMLCPHYF